MVYEMSQSSSKDSRLSQRKNIVRDEISIEELSNEILLFFLNFHCCSEPIKKTTIEKYFKNVSSVKVFNDVIPRVKHKLDEVFGIDLIETSKNGTMEYYLSNGLKGEVDLTLEQKNNLDDHQLVLLNLILLVIYKSGNKMKEENILEFLNCCKIIKDMKNPIASKFFHNLDVKRFLRKELVTMNYLSCIDYNSDYDDEEKIYEFCWGIRAENEVSVEKLEKLFEEIDDVSDNENVIDEVSEEIVDGDSEED